MAHLLTAIVCAWPKYKQSVSENEFVKNIRLDDNLDLVHYDLAFFLFYWKFFIHYEWVWNVVCEIIICWRSCQIKMQSFVLWKMHKSWKVVICYHDKSCKFFDCIMFDFHEDAKVNLL